MVHSVCVCSALALPFDLWFEWFKMQRDAAASLVNSKNFLQYFTIRQINYMELITLQSYAAVANSLHTSCFTQKVVHLFYRSCFGHFFLFIVLIYLNWEKWKLFAFFDRDFFFESLNLNHFSLSFFSFERFEKLYRILNKFWEKMIVSIECKCVCALSTLRLHS